MTLRVTIGKLKENVGYLKDNGMQNSEVIPCPELNYDLCSEEFTIYPRESIRDGPYSTFPDFISCYFPKMAKDLNLNGVERLYKYHDDIVMLSKIPKTRLDADRIKWFKFWEKRATELYGSEAAIEFS